MFELRKAPQSPYCTVLKAQRCSAVASTLLMGAVGESQEVYHAGLTARCGTRATEGNGKIWVVWDLACPEAGGMVLLASWQL